MEEKTETVNISLNETTQEIPVKRSLSRDLFAPKSLEGIREEGGRTDVLVILSLMYEMCSCYFITDLQDVLLLFYN